jgi:hypothetical protein
LKLVFDLRHVAEFSAAYGREILRMREQHGPAIADPLMEADVTFSRIGLEVQRRR